MDINTKKRGSVFSGKSKAGRNGLNLTCRRIATDVKNGIIKGGKNNNETPSWNSCVKSVFKAHYRGTAYVIAYIQNHNGDSNRSIELVEHDEIGICQKNCFHQR